MLALHGWLDNAASFLPMAPFLGTLELVAIDLPGHGRSAHLPAGADYSFPGAIASVLDVADALGWERFALLGHSMGAGIASVVAAACPERIEKLVAVEALGALADAAERTVQRMREAVAASMAEAIANRMESDPTRTPEQWQATLFVAAAQGIGTMLLGSCYDQAWTLPYQVMTVPLHDD